MNPYIAALFCVGGIAIGQLLFKACAEALRANGGALSLHSAAYMGAAMVLYGLTSIAWVLTLRHVELGKVYPLMALAFIFVPLASHYIFGEKFQASYFVGIAFIMVGIFITTRQG